MKGGSNTRNPNKFNHFHHDYEHDIEECLELKKEIERLISEGYL
jgi:hypothetical protein